MVLFLRVCAHDIHGFHTWWAAMQLYVDCAPMGCLERTYSAHRLCSPVLKSGSRLYAWQDPVRLLAEWQKSFTTAVGEGPGPCT